METAPLQAAQSQWRRTLASYLLTRLQREHGLFPSDAFYEKVHRYLRGDAFTPDAEFDRTLQLLSKDYIPALEEGRTTIAHEPTSSTDSAVTHDLQRWILRDRPTLTPAWSKSPYSFTASIFGEQLPSKLW
ncbi:hypothetical protein GF324_07620, partial [bacterium]|nr:hypothetical protein [bacterium]